MSEKINKPCRVGGVTFQVGVSVDTVIKESQRLYESQLNNPEKPLVEMKELRKLIMGTHVLVPKTPTNSMVSSGQNSCEDFLYHYQVSSVWDAMIKEVEKKND